MPTSQDLLHELHTVDIAAIWAPNLSKKERASLVKLLKQKIKIIRQQIKHEQSEIKRRWDNRKKGEALQEALALAPFSTLELLIKKIEERLAELNHAVEFGQPVPDAPDFGTRFIEYIEDGHKVISIVTAEKEVELKRAHIKEQLGRASELFKAVQYANASSIVAAIDHPRAKELLEKIEARRAIADAAKVKAAAQATKIEPIKLKNDEKIKHAPQRSILRGLILFAAIFVGVVGFGTWFVTRPTYGNEPAATLILSTPTALYLDLEAPLRADSLTTALDMSCQVTFSDQRSRVTSAEFTGGCLREANRIAIAYQDGTLFCYEHHNQTLGTFMDCLDRRQVGFLFDTLVKPTAVPVVIATTSYTSSSSSGSGRPKNCTEAKARGMSESEAGSYSNLDRDGDGKACYGD